MQLPVERRGERPSIQHGEVVGVDPVPRGPERGLDPLVKRGPRQRVGHRHSDVIRLAGAHQVERARDVVTGLARIAELQEEPDLDTLVVKPPGRLHDLLHPDALLHRVQYPL